MLNSRNADGFSGLLINPAKQTPTAKENGRDFLEYNRKEVSHSGPLVYGGAFWKSGKEPDDLTRLSSRANLSKLSGLVATRTSAPEDHRSGPLTLEPVNQAGRSRRSFPELECAGKRDVRHHMPKTTESPQTAGGRACIKEPMVSFLTFFFLLNCIKAIHALHATSSTLKPAYSYQCYYYSPAWSWSEGKQDLRLGSITCSIRKC